MEHRSRIRMEQPMLKKTPWHFACGLWLYQLPVWRAGQTVFTSLRVFPTHLSSEPYPQLFFPQEELGNRGLTSEHWQSDTLGRPPTVTSQGSYYLLICPGLGPSVSHLFWLKKYLLPFKATAYDYEFANYSYPFELVFSSDFISNFIWKFKAQFYLVIHKCYRSIDLRSYFEKYIISIL